MKKSIQIEVPNGYEIDKENSTFENIVFKPIKADLPETWGDIGYIEGYCVLSGCEIEHNFSSSTKFDDNKNIFVTEEQAEASIALAQLSQLREVYRDGWKPNWKDNNLTKYSIRIYRGEPERDTSFRYHNFLSFQSAEVRDMFLKNFRDLIEQAKPFMS